MTPASLRCVREQDHPSLVLVQPRKTCPFITERILMGRKESNQTNKQQYMLDANLKNGTPPFRNSHFGTICES